MAHNLTKRETEVLELVTLGWRNGDIARQLGISHQTVKNHLTLIFDKLHVYNRTSAAMLALTEKLVVEVKVDRKPEVDLY